MRHTLLLSFQELSLLSPLVVPLGNKHARLLRQRLTDGPIALTIRQNKLRLLDTVHADLDSVPNSVRRLSCWIEPDRILFAKFERDLITDGPKLRLVFALGKVTGTATSPRHFR